MEYLQILEEKMRYDQNLVFSVVVFDINQLKMINDDLGHDQGDRLIIETANEIREVFGGNRIYRIGGDEFVAILDNQDPSDLIAKLRIIIDKKNKVMPVFKDVGIDMSISVGFAAYNPETDKTYTDVFHRADNAMYADKRAFYQTHEDRRRSRS